MPVSWNILLAHTSQPTVVLDYTYYRVGNLVGVLRQKKKNNLFSNEEEQRRGLAASNKQQ